MIDRNRVGVRNLEMAGPRCNTLACAVVVVILFAAMTVNAVGQKVSGELEKKARATGQPETRGTATSAGVQDAANDELSRSPDVPNASDVERMVAEAYSNWWPCRGDIGPFEIPREYYGKILKFFRHPARWDETALKVDNQEMGTIRLIFSGRRSVRLCWFSWDEDGRLSFSYEGSRYLTTGKKLRDAPEMALDTLVRQIFKETHGRCGYTEDIPMAEIGSAYRMLGRTGELAGRILTLDGVVARGDRSQAGGRAPILQVQKINGRASQACIEVPIRPCAADVDKPVPSANSVSPRPHKSDVERSVPQWEIGQTYELSGYETGEFVPVCDEHGRQSKNAGFGFTSWLAVVKAKKVAPLVFSPADFVGQGVLIHGKATNHDGRMWLVGPGWEVEVLRGGLWPESLANARVAVTGVVRKGERAGQPQINPRRVRRDRLEEQVNQRVELRGTIRELNDRWYLLYNGQQLLVDRLDLLALQTAINVGDAAEVRGVLRRERFRDESLDGEHAEPKERYIVREAECTAVDDLLPIERVAEPCPWSIGAR